MQQKGFQLEHCRPECPKLARDWKNLYQLLTKKLNELDLTERLNDRFETVLHHHLPKVSLAGCPNGCSQPSIKDFGISGYKSPKITNSPCSGCQSCVKSCLEKAISWQTEGIKIDPELCLSCGNCQKVCPTGTLTAGESGWLLRLGGRVGRHPKFATEVGRVATDEEVVHWITEILLEYIAEGRPEERLTHFLEKIALTSNLR